MKNVIAVLAMATTTLSPPHARGQSPEMLDRDNVFCSYVLEFSQQLARNHIRNVPFSRLDHFDYFGSRQAIFMQEIATEIYAELPGPLSERIEHVGDHYFARCEDVFEND